MNIFIFENSSQRIAILAFGEDGAKELFSRFLANRPLLPKITEWALVKVAGRLTEYAYAL